MKQRFLLFSFAVISAVVSAETWQIGNVQYSIYGKTTEQALARILKIDTKHIFISHEELTAYVESLRSLLANCRIFDSTSVIETLSAPDKNSIIKDQLTITVHDTKNIIAVPYPSYSSNTGPAIKLKLKDYNFNGTLSPLSASLYYASDDDTFDTVTDKLVGGDISLVTPFSLWNKDAFIITSANAAYTLNRHSMLFDASTQFEYYPVQLGPLSWGPYISLRGSRNDAYSEGGYEYSSAAGQKLTTQNISWNGNFRDGYAFFVIQTADYDFVNSKPFFANTIDAEQFKAFSRNGLSAHEYFVYQSNNELVRNAGSYLRGIRDKDIRTDLLFVCNADIPFRLASVQFPESSGLSLFNFELQCSPFIDIALGHNTAVGTWFNPKDGWYTLGMDVNLFPVRWRSLQVHCSIGFDAVKMLQHINSSAADSIFDTAWRTNPAFEISAGIGLFY